MTTLESSELPFANQDDEENQQEQSNEPDGGNEGTRLTAVASPS